ncbi:MAG: LysM peptidoglycan-binding domain-containing protein [Actinobacteria bacterium]|nr:LysM peptidoglycan-binding domain-containing protein [Actinomycetota bacterium]
MVTQGETLSGIARHFGTTVEALVAANNIENPDVIHPGQELIIPETQP